MVESIGIKDDEEIFEYFRIMAKAREHLQELTALEKLALEAIGVTVLRDTETGKNIVVK
jgi:hypothetical protein